MKRMMRGALMALPLAAAELTPVAWDQVAAQAALIAEYTAPISDLQLSEMKAFDERLRDYWTARGAGAVAVKLVIVQRSDEVAVCGTGKGTKEFHADNAAGGEYCWPNDQVQMTRDFVNSLDFLSTQAHMPESAVLEIAEAHEWGHAVEDASGEQPPRTMQQSQAVEQRADCYAGQALAELDPAAAAWAPTLYTAMEQAGGPDLLHGSAEARISHFETGRHGGDCQA